MRPAVLDEPREGNRVPGLTRATLTARFPALQRGRRWYGGGRPRMDAWTVALGPCVTLSAHVLVLDERVEQVGYLYTCPTRASR